MPMAVRRDTWVGVIFMPQRSPTILVTLRVDTPWRYMVATAALQGAVGAGVAALVRLGLEMGGAFKEHGGVEEALDDLREAVGDAVLEKEIDGLVVECKVLVLGHGWCCFWFAPSVFSFD